MTYEFKRVTIKRFTSENKDGSGKVKILEQYSGTVDINSTSGATDPVKKAYAEVKKLLKK